MAGSVVRMFLGELTPEAVLAAANHPNSQIKSERICEANFYVGMLALQHGRKDEAVRRSAPRPAAATRA